MGENLPAPSGRLRREAAGLSAAWLSFVPDHVVGTLLGSPGRTPVANTERADAVVLVIDVVGFTPLSEALTRSGAYGIEELTRILNGWFDSMADLVSRYGGSVVEFAGDALTAVFWCDSGIRRLTERRAVRCALDMQAEMAGFQTIITRAGTFELAMKAGLAAGPLLSTVVGDPAIRLCYVLAGPALDRATAAERHAGRGEVVVDRGLLEGGMRAEVMERRGRWSVVGSVRERVSQVRPAPAPLDSIDEETARRLAPFLHPAIAERLRAGRRDLVNEHRKVTVAFVGLPGLAAADSWSVDALQRFLAAAVRVIDRYDGHLRQVATGDKGSLLLAYFGAPVSHENDEERAVRCSLELLALPGGPFRAGITTGYVYCGEVGSDARREYAVIGDSVNLAERLMQAAEPGQLLIDRPTHGQVRDTTVHDGLESISVKGKTGRIDVWAVHAVHDRPRNGPAGPATPQPLVGRDDEVARSRALVVRALAGEGQVVCLTGEAGIGKSRLGAEVIRMAEGLGFAVYAGACRSHGTTTSYLVWRAIWCDLLELDTSLPIAEQKEQLTERIARRDGGSAQRAPLLGPVVNVPMPDSELTASLDPQTRDELLRSLLLECLRDRAATAPLLLVLDDCHWIDAASHALLEFLGRHVADQPVLILAIARRTVGDPSPLASLSQLPHFTELRLAELASADAERLVGLRLRERYGADTVAAPGVVRRITDRGEGNPFYLEELVSYLHTRGIDPRDPRALAALELPDGLQRLVMARIDQLSEGEKATIKVASVIGRRCRAHWISETYPAAGRPEEVAYHLERLDRLELMSSLPAAPESEYQFKHAITQEVAYQSLTFQMREALHERVGLFIERTYPDRLAQYVEVLAHHYARTRRADKQRRWFRAAGDGAKATFANEAAVDYYERLLLLLPEDQTGEVLVELGAVWHLTGRSTEAERAYRRAMEVASRAGRREVLAASQRELGALFMDTQSYAEAVSWLSRAANEFERLGDRGGLSKTLDRITFALYQQGAYGKALAAAGRHLAMATEAGDLAGVSIALNYTGLVRLNTGQTTAALTLLQQALDTATRAGDRRCLLYAAGNLGLAHLRYGDHMRAVACCHQALSVAQEMGDRRIAGVYIGNMGEVYRDQGDHIQATRCFVHALRIAVEVGDWTSVADQVANVASTAAAQGHEREAERLFSRAIALARLLDAPYFLCGWLHQLAKLRLAQGRLDEAERLNQEALGVANERNEREIQVRAQLLSLRLRVTLGRIDADAAIRRLRALEDAWSEPHERAPLLAALWQLDPAQEAARKAAADLYRTLYERAPSIEYREAYARLTGTMLPPGPPLPPLPKAVEDDVQDLGALLRQVDEAVTQLRAPRDPLASAQRAELSPQS